MSPYLNLFRSESGGVDNYNAFVRPEQELRDTMQRQQTDLRQQSADIASLERQVAGPARTSVSRGMRSGGMFLQYLHYYPMQQSLPTRGRTSRR